MRVGLCNIKVAANKGYQKGIEDVVQKFKKNPMSFVSICFARFLVSEARRLKPGNVCDLQGFKVRQRHTTEKICDRCTLKSWEISCSDMVSKRLNLIK